MAEIILPGTYITVRDEGLITAGRVVTGNIGIVGTANKGPVDEVKIIGTFTEAREIFGEADDWGDGTGNKLTLMRAIEQVFNNGGRTVYAVRTGAGTLAAAQFQFKDSASANTGLFKAKTPGTWGNDIQIKVSAADQSALVSENFKGNSTKLNRKVDKDSTANSISVRQKATGATISYTIIYTGIPAIGEVRINPADSILTFPPSAVPAVDDDIIARYEALKIESRKVEFIYQEIKETYVVADVSHLAEQVNRRSILVRTEKDDNVETIFYGKLPTANIVLTVGTNGEAATAADYKKSLEKLEQELINIVLLAGQDDTKSAMVTALAGHLNVTAETRHERIAVIGCNGTTDVNEVAKHDLDSDRIIYVGPGIRISNSENLTGAYTAAAVAGLLSSLPVQTSPTNKVLTIPGLSAEYSSSRLEKLVMNRVLAVEKREGFRIVKGITTATNTAWHQITTRRIVDYAIYGVRSCCNPYIGKLNNERVRGAMKATIDAFLTRMTEDEALVNYDLEVNATRAQEIAGECIVTMTIRPTFSIDFVRVTMYLG